jgi:ribosomal protein L28
MARTCAICGKGYITTIKRKKLRSKYNPTIKKRKYPNLQWVKLGNRRIKACTKCIKKMSKAK